MFAPRRHVLRALMRTPVVSTAAIVTLALGIGTATASVGVVDATMLQRLPWPSSERLMDASLSLRTPGEPDARMMVCSYPTYVTPCVHGSAPPRTWRCRRRRTSRWAEARDGSGSAWNS